MVGEDKQSLTMRLVNVLLAWAIAPLAWAQDVRGYDRYLRQPLRRQVSSGITPPSQDPFYQPPADCEYQVGAVELAS